MATHTAIVTHEGTDTILRFPESIRLPDGPILILQDEPSGTINIIPHTQAISPSAPKSWLEFFDVLDALPRDEQWEDYMTHRPGNEVSVARTLFPND